MRTFIVALVAVLLAACGGKQPQQSVRYGPASQARICVVNSGASMIRVRVTPRGMGATKFPTQVNGVSECRNVFVGAAGGPMQIVVESYGQRTEALEPISVRPGDLIEVKVPSRIAHTGVMFH